MTISLRAFITHRLVLALAILGSTYLAGYLTAEHRLFPSQFVQRVENRLVWEAKTYLPKPVPVMSKLPAADIETVFVGLHVEGITVPLQRAGDGGGLTSVGDELLLLAHEGSIFRVTDNAVERTTIETPPNGFDDYVAASKSDKYKDFNHIFAWFRYMDILFYTEAGKQGLVISYTDYSAEKECYRSTIARLELPDRFESIMDVQAVAGDWTILHQTNPCLPLKKQWRAIEGHIAGGRLAYRAPHTVIYGAGDYHWDGVFAPEALAQRPEADYGKVLEIDLQSGRTKTVSIGNRNPQGVYVDKQGEIWVTEHGPRGGDELNHIVEGENYGWPLQAYGTNYNYLPWPGMEGYGRHDHYKKPVYSWVPSVGISNLIRIDGFTPSWDGDLLAASLAGKTLFRLRIQDGAVIFAEPIEIGERIRYVHQHTDGRLVLWTDAKKLFFISVGETNLVHANIESYIAESHEDRARQDKLKSVIESCSECHSFEANVHTGAPGLGAIFESPIAATSYAGYSAALRGRPGSWSARELSRFLIDPQAYAPGTTMPNPGIRDEDLIKDLVRILAHVKSEQSEPAEVPAMTAEL